MEFQELTPEQINEIATAAGRPSYSSVLQDFLNADIQGANLTNSYAGKKLNTVAQGLKNAQRKNAAFSSIKVVYTVSDGAEFLALIKQQ